MDRLIEEYMYPNRNVRVALLLNNFSNCVRERGNAEKCKKELDKLIVELHKKKPIKNK